MKESTTEREAVSSETQEISSVLESSAETIANIKNKTSDIKTNGDLIRAK